MLHIFQSASGEDSNHRQTKRKKSNREDDGTNERRFYIESMGIQGRFVLRNVTNTQRVKRLGILACTCCCGEQVRSGLSSDSMFTSRPILAWNGAFRASAHPSHMHTPTPTHAVPENIPRQLWNIYSSWVTPVYLWRTAGDKDPGWDEELTALCT